jgi:hypothetical protein
LSADHVTRGAGEDPDEDADADKDAGEDVDRPERGATLGRPPRVRSLSPSVRNVPSEKWDGRSLHFIELVNNRLATRRTCKQPSDRLSADHVTRGAGEDPDEDADKDAGEDVDRPERGDRRADLRGCGV